MFTYWFHNPETGLTKIGRTSSPKRRFGTLSSKFPVVAMRIIKGDVEAKMHRDFARFRVHGEWFALPEKETCELSAIDPATLPMGDWNPKNKALLEISPEIHAQIAAVAKQHGITRKRLVDSLLTHGIDRIESGKLKISDCIFTESEVAKP